MKICIPTSLPGGLLAKVQPLEDAECFTLVSIRDQMISTEVLHPPESFEAVPNMLMASGVSIMIVPSAPNTISQLWQCSIRVFIGDSENAGDMLSQYRNGFLAEI